MRGKGALSAPMEETSPQQKEPSAGERRTWFVNLAEKKIAPESCEKKGIGRACSGKNRPTREGGKRFGKLERNLPHWGTLRGREDGNGVQPSNRNVWVRN